jgi:hypothetical protein
VKGRRLRQSDDLDGLSRAVNGADLPDGQSGDLRVQPPLQKYSASPFGRNSFIDFAIPSH